MMESVTEVLHQLPWLGGALSWVLGGLFALLVWALAAFPAYLLSRFVRNSRGRLTHWSSTSLQDKPRAVNQPQVSGFALGVFNQTHNLLYLRDKNTIGWQQIVD